MSDTTTTVEKKTVSGEDNEGGQESNPHSSIHVHSSAASTSEASSSETTDSEFLDETSSNVRRMIYEMLVTSGHQYTDIPHPSPKCPRCSNHGLEFPVKGHKKSCEYRNCDCRLCLITVERQNFMADLVATRRDQLLRQSKNQFSDPVDD